MSRGLKIRAFLAAAIVGGCASAFGLMYSANSERANTPVSSTPAVNASVGAANKASNNDLARRYRRVARRRSVVVI